MPCFHRISCHFRLHLNTFQNKAPNKRFCCFPTLAVLSQELVEVRPGQDILLPCCYVKNDRPMMPDVFWRSEDEAHLYDIIAGKPDLGSQDRRFHKRTESFPKQYGRGNYSVLLQRVTVDDSGLYTCYLPSQGFQQLIELQVTTGRS